MICANVEEKTKGTIHVLEVRRGDMLKTPNGWRIVQDLRQNFFSVFNKIFFEETNKVMCTNDTEFLRVNRSVVQARYLKKGDKVVGEKRNYTIKENVSIKGTLFGVTLYVDSNYGAYYTNGVLVFKKLAVIPDKVNKL